MVDKNNIKNSKRVHPNPADVLEAVKDLKTCGALVQHPSTGELVMEVEECYVGKSLEILKDYGYTGVSNLFIGREHVFLFNICSIQILDKIEAKNMKMDEDTKDDLRFRTVPFKVVDAFAFQPQIRILGVESLYLIRVESAELVKLRKDLTGLPPPDLGFCIIVGIRLEEAMLDKTEEKPETKTNNKPKPEPKKKSSKINEMCVLM